MAKRVVVESDDSFLGSMMGEKIVLYCSRYIYCGILTGVDEDSLQLKDCKIVFDTGAHDAKEWAISEPTLTSTWTVMRQSIESWGLSNK